MTRDRRRVCAGAGDLKFRIWDADTTKLLHEVPSDDQIVMRLSLSLDGKRAAGAVAANRMMVWNIDDGALVRCIKHKKSFVNGAAISPDGRIVAQGGTDGILRIADVGTGDEIVA